MGHLKDLLDMQYGSKLIEEARRARGAYGPDFHLDNTNMHLLKNRTLEEQALEGKCHALWLLNGGQTSEWNGDGCDCGYTQGNLNCKLNPF